MTASGPKTSTQPTTTDATKRRRRGRRLGAYIYHEESKPRGIEMNFGKDDVSIEQN